MKKTQIVESFVTKGQILEQESKNDAILCRAKYHICSIGEKNRNNRVYEKAVWDRVLADKDISAKLENRSLFFHAEHPSTTQSNTEKVAGVVTDIILNEDDNKVSAVMEVLDTPYGRIVDTLLKAGCGIGVSTRADGELEEALDETGGKYQRVVPESYRFVTIDFTADPSTFGSELPITVERDVTNVIKNGLQDNKIDRQYATVLLEELSTPEAVALLESLKEEKDKYEPYQPKTGEKCSCKRGIERDNCPECEGTGEKIDFKKIRARHDESVNEIIKKVGDKWQVQSHEGKNLGTYDTEAEAKKRLGQVEYFKHKNESKDGDKKCKVCGKPAVKEYEAEDGSFCSKKCLMTITDDTKVEEGQYTTSSDKSDQPADSKAAQKVVKQSSARTKATEKPAKEAPMVDGCKKVGETVKVEEVKEKQLEKKVNQFLTDNWDSFHSQEDVVENLVRVFKIGENDAKQYVEKMEESKGTISAVAARSNEKETPSGIESNLAEMSERLASVTAERDQLVENYGKDAVSHTIKIKDLAKQLIEQKALIKKHTETIDGLKEKVAEMDKAAKVKVDEHKEELNKVKLLNEDLSEGHEAEIKSIQEKHKEEVETLKEAHKRDLISFYVSTKTRGMGLHLPKRTLTLLEECNTVEEVDALIRKTQNALREKWVQSADGVSEIVVNSHSDPNPAVSDMRKKVGIALQHFGV